LRCSDIEFIRADGSIMLFNDPSATTAAVRVMVTFRDQKNGKKFDKRTMSRTTDPLLCPVKLWLQIVSNVQSLPRTDINSPVCTYFDHKLGKLAEVNADDMLLFLREICRAMGPERVGYLPSQIGNKSIRSGCAMALFINKTSVPMIMMAGRWSSDAFLVYIRPQVLEWSGNLSNRLIAVDHWRNGTFASNQDPNDPLIPRDPRAARNAGANLSHLYQLNGSLPNLHDTINLHTDF
jgi:hypothetical protein